MGKKEIEITGVIWVSSTFSTFVQNACPKTQTMKMTFTVKNAALMKYYNEINKTCFTFVSVRNVDNK